MIRNSRLAVVMLLCAALPPGVAAPSVVAGQEPGVVARADAIRDTLSRPPDGHGVSLGDIVAFPYRLATWPVDLALEGIAEAAGFVAAPRRFRPFAEGYRCLEALGIRPAVTTDTGLRSGLAFAVDGSMLAPVVIETELSVRGYQRHRLSVRKSTGQGSTAIAASYRLATQDPFWGIGLETAERPRSDFLQEVWAISGTAGRRFGRSLRVTIRAGWERSIVGRGRDRATRDAVETFADAGLAGLDEASELSILEMGVEMDRVGLDDELPRGWRWTLFGRQHMGTGDTGVDFLQSGGTAVGFLPLTSHHYVSLRGTLEATLGGEGRVPFVYLPTLGGSSLRSYDSGRFRHRTMAAGSLGLHWELWRDLRERAHIEAFTFVEQGSAGSALSSLPHPRTSWGFGLGGRWSDILLVSGYVASGAEGTRWSGSVSTHPF